MTRVNVTDEMWLAAAKVIDPLAFDPDPKVRHQHCSPVSVDAVQGEAMRMAKAVLVAGLSAAPSPDGEEVERVARAINPRAWEVMDHELRKTQEKYAGQRVSWPVSQFQHKESMDQARAAIAAMRPTSPEPPE